MNHDNLQSEQVSLYTCLYITNSCINDCGYCGFRKSNDSLERITLTKDEVIFEARAILESGVNNAIIIGGTQEEKDYKDIIIQSTEVCLEEGLTPWIEFENLSYKTLRELKGIGANHFVLFQETYNRDLFSKVHRYSPLKKDYDARLKKVDEAMDAGFQYINIGVLFGLNKDYEFEIDALCKHAKDIQTKGANPIVSVPTLSSKIDSEKLLNIILSIKKSLPDVPIALSGREKNRDKLFSLVDYVGTGGVTFPGGRTIHKDSKEVLAQFSLGDQRTPKEIIELLKNMGLEIK